MMNQSLTRYLTSAEAHFRGGELAAAEKLLRRVLAREPTNSKANELMGYIAGNRGQMDYSFELLKTATISSDASAQAFYYLGKHFLERNFFEKAAAAFHQSLQRAGDFFEGLHDLGVALAGCGKPAAALEFYDRALALNPASYQLLYNKGVALDALNRLREALPQYDRALALNPEFAFAWHNRGSTLNDLTRVNGAQASLDQALASFSKALALAPDIPYLPGDVLQTRMKLCLWAGDIEQQFESVLCGIDAKSSVTTPFLSLSIPATPAQQRRCAENFVRDKFPPSTTVNIPRAKREPHGKIRVGYFSPDFRLHPVSFLTAGLFEHHDRTRFETHAFALGPSSDDAMTQRLRAAFDYFHDTGAMPVQDIVSLAHTLGLDIAVDLAGHTQGARTGVLARRVAPIQAHYLGYPGTMGAEFIDYIIADETVIPEATMKDYTEKIVFLPHCFQVNDATRRIAATPSRASVGIDENAFVYCSFNGVYKLNPQIFDCWMNILRRADHSVLWLVGESHTQIENLKAWAAARGVAPQRLIFAGKLPYAEHLARYQLVDLVLDTLPFNGGASTSDALWGGAPVLTCTGETFVGRMAASLLHAIGLDEWVTHTLDDYEAKALYLARHPIEMAALKKKLAVNRGTHPLFDTALCTRHIEAAYVEMWWRHESDLPPTHLRIPRLPAA